MRLRVVELFGEDSRNDRVVFIQLRTKSRSDAGMVDDRTGNGDDVGQEGIEGTGKSLDLMDGSTFNVQLFPGPRI